MVRVSAFLAAVAMFISWVGVCQAQDKVIGAIWQVNYKNDQGKYVSFGLIRCTVDGKVFIDGKEVGTHKNTNLDKVEIQITNSPNPGVNGKSTATKVKKDGTVWEGVHKRADGKEVPIRMFLKKD